MDDDVMFDDAPDDGVDVGSEAGVDPAQPEPIAAEPAVPASPAWAPNPDEWQQLVESNRQMQQLISQAMQPAPEPLPELNAFDDNFGETLEQRLARMQDDLKGTLQQALTPLYQQQTEHWVEETVTNLPTHVKHEFTDEALGLFRDTARQVPGNAQGITGLAQQIAGIEKAAAAKAVAAYKQSLAQTPVDGGPTGGGAATEITDAPSDYDGIIDAFAARRTV